MVSSPKHVENDLFIFSNVLSGVELFLMVKFGLLMIFLKHSRIKIYI